MQEEKTMRVRVNWPIKDSRLVKKGDKEVAEIVIHKEGEVVDLPDELVNRLPAGNVTPVQAEPVPREEDADDKGKGKGKGKK